MWHVPPLHKICSRQHNIDLLAAWQVNTDDLSLLQNCSCCLWYPWWFHPSTGWWCFLPLSDLRQDIQRLEAAEKAPEAAWGTHKQVQVLWQALLQTWCVHQTWKQCSQPGLYPNESTHVCKQLTFTFLTRKASQSSGKASRILTSQYCSSFSVGPRTSFFYCFVMAVFVYMCVPVLEGALGYPGCSSMQFLYAIHRELW